MDHGRLNLVLFLDLAKAFDTVNHDILIDKLKIYGVGPRSLLWFKSYLNMREQKCEVDGFVSCARTIGCGVPQGSILGHCYF